MNTEIIYQSNIFLIHIIYPYRFCSLMISYDDILNLFVHGPKKLTWPTFSLESS